MGAGLGSDWQGMQCSVAEAISSGGVQHDWAR